MPEAYYYEDLRFDGMDTRQDFEIVLESLEWEIMGYRAYLKNFTHTPQHPLINDIMRTEQERLQVRCAIANARKRARRG